MVDPALITIGGVAVAAGAAFAYSYLTGNDTDVSADLDGDGEADASYTIEGNDNAPFDGVDSPDEVTVKKGEEVFESGVELAADTLEDVNGIGPYLSEQLQQDGFETPEDLYYASDAALEDVKGFGERTIGMVRDDIGGIDYDANEDE